MYLKRQFLHILPFMQLVLQVGRVAVLYLCFLFLWIAMLAADGPFSSNPLQTAFCTTQVQHDLGHALHRYSQAESNILGQSGSLSRCCMPMDRSWLCTAL